MSNPPIAADCVIAPDVLAVACTGDSTPLTDLITAARAAGRRCWCPAAVVAATASAGVDGRRLAEVASALSPLATLAGDCAGPTPLRSALEAAVRRLGSGTVVITGVAGYAEGRSLSAALSAGFAAAPIPFVDLAARHEAIRPALEDRLHRVLHHGHFIMGPEIAELESALSNFVGRRHAITVASGTTALEIALRALGIGPGDEVITAPFTWIASAEVIGLVGAIPVFVDIDPVSFLIDPALIEAAITPRTKAILPVSLFGQMPDLDLITALADRHGLPVIEDAAQSFGASRHGRPSGGATRIGATSFFPAKPLGCLGDGGALFTDDDGLAERMRSIRTHGGIRRHHHPHLGTNGRMDTLQAATVLARLPGWAAELAQRQVVAARYDLALESLVGIPAILPGNTHVYAQYTIRLADRDGVAQRMTASGIPTAVYYPTGLHQQPVFAHGGARWASLPQTERTTMEVLSLPMHPDLGTATQDRIIAALRAALG